jgi:hypothetical protein
MNQFGSIALNSEGLYLRGNTINFLDDASSVKVNTRLDKWMVKEEAFTTYK